MTTPTADANGEQLQAHLDAMDARDSEARREQTAATLLAAIIAGGKNFIAVTEGDDRRQLAVVRDQALIAVAVGLADALRAELRKTEGA